MLYYTGAVQHGAVQNDPNRSLGGWISSSPIQNDVFDNLFNKIDYYQIKNKLKPIRVIAFQNTNSTPISALRVWIEHLPTSFATYKIGLILNSIDPSCGKPYFEQIQNPFSSPIYVELADCLGEENALTIENIPAGEYVGVFVQRNLLAENNPDLGGAKKSCNDYFAEFETEQNNPSNEDENIDLEDEIKIIFSDESAIRV